MKIIIHFTFQYEELLTIILFNQWYRNKITCWGDLNVFLIDRFKSSNITWFLHPICCSSHTSSTPPVQFLQLFASSFKYTYTPIHLPTTTSTTKHSYHRLILLPTTHITKHTHHTDTTIHHNPTKIVKK